MVCSLSLLLCLSHQCLPMSKCIKLYILNIYWYNSLSYINYTSSKFVNFLKLQYLCSSTYYRRHCLTCIALIPTFHLHASYPLVTWFHYLLCPKNNLIPLWLNIQTFFLESTYSLAREYLIFLQGTIQKPLAPKYNQNNKNKSTLFIVYVLFSWPTVSEKS